MRRTRRIVSLLLWPLLVVGLVLAFHWRAVQPGAAITGGDLEHYFVPVRSMVLRTVFGGHWPFWQRGIDAGFPMLASSEMGLFHLTTWLFPFRPVERALTLGLLFHLCAAALGTFLWQRRRGRSAGASATAAFIVALGGFTTVHLDHWTFSASLMWVPFAFLAVDAFVQSGRPRWFLFGAVALAGAWYGGAAQIAYFASLAVGGYALFRVAGAPSRWAIVLVVPAALLLAAPVLFAGAELNALGPRAAGTTIQYAGGWYRFEEWKDLAGLLLPHFAGPPRAWSGRMFFWEMTGYVGAGTLALIFAARPRGAGWFFALLIPVALLASFGITYDLWGFLYRHLPGYASLRVPTRALFFVNLAAAFLAADALDHLASHRKLRVDLAIAVSSMAFAALALWLGAHWQELGFRVEAHEGARWAAGILACVAALIILRRWVPAPVIAVAAAALTFVDLRHQFGDYAEVLPARELARYWPRLPGPTGDAPRVGVIRLPFNMAAAQGLESPVGYSQIMVGRIFDLYFAARSGHFSPSATTPIGFEYGQQDIAPYLPLFPLWSVSRVVSSYPLQHPLLRFEGRQPAGWSYTYLAPLPIGFWSSQYRVLDDEGFQREVASFRPHEDLFVAPTDIELPPSQAQLQRRPARIAERTPNATVLDVEAPAAGLVVLLDPWFPGWSATVDGKPTPVVRADYAFMAVPVAAGSHRVEFSYFPATLPWALLAIAGTLAAIALWSWLWKRRNQPSRSARSNGVSTVSLTHTP